MYPVVAFVSRELWLLLRELVSALRAGDHRRVRIALLELEAFSRLASMMRKKVG